MAISITGSSGDSEEKVSLTQINFKIPYYIFYYFAQFAKPNAFD